VKYRRRDSFDPLRPGVSRGRKKAAREAREGGEVAGVACKGEKIARDANGKRTASAQICAETTGECQVDKNAKGNCQTVGYMILRILLKTKNAKGNCQTVGVALSIINIIIFSYNLGQT
jgi:hypothetical protein